MLLVVLTCVAPRFRRLELPTYPADFNVYYCAASLVRHGNAAQLYQGADTGADPQKALAQPGSALFQTAHAQGLPFVGLYVYPPILADLLVPITHLSLAAATRLWLLLNGLFLALTALLTIRLLGYPLLSPPAALIAVALACFTPALQCLVDGQITIVLLLLWAAAMRLYQRGYDTPSAALFALATAIKLTPVIVLLPFLLWRKGRFAAAFLATLVLLAALSATVDTPQTFHLYLARVLPAMSGAIPAWSNFSLAASTQRVLTLLRTGSVAPSPPSLPAGTVLAGRIASALGLAAILLLIARTRRSTGRPQQLLVLALLSLAAPILSPVSWFHAYTTAFLAFAFLWQDATSRPTTPLYLATLTAVTLLLGSAVSENLIPYLLFHGHPALSSLLHLGQLLAALAVIFHQIALLKRPPSQAPAPAGA